MVFLKSLPKLAVLMIAFGVTSSLAAQGGPADYDLEIRLDSGSYDKGDTVTATVGIVARVAGLQGWSMVRFTTMPFSTSRLWSSRPIPRQPVLSRLSR